MHTPQRIVIVGAGFGGLSAAALLAHHGHDVTVVEKNDQPGGRAMVWKKDGFSFDMGPSWYLMPDVFERFFKQCGRDIADYVTLHRLDPSYRLIFGEGKTIDIPAAFTKTQELFDTLEQNGGAKLKRYVDEAAYKYDVSMQGFLYKEYRHIWDFFSWKLLTEGWRLNVFGKFDPYVRTFFDSEQARKILEYSIVFLGGSPYNTPAVYSLLSHVDFNLGVWYPEGGMHAVAEAIEKVAKEEGVIFRYDEPVQKVITRDGKAVGVQTHKDTIQADRVIVNADYHHAETQLLDEAEQTYPQKYWDKRTMAPSAFIMHLGINKRIKNLKHHTLFLEHDWMQHFDDIFERPAWPDRPSYYICAPSKTDNDVAPKGCENLFILVPVASDLEDSPEHKKKYGDKIIAHLQSQIGENISDHIIVRRDFAHSDFASTFNAYRGSALGLAHTLWQTALFRPSHRSKKVKGLYYTGQYTHPGIGVPMTLISAHIIDSIIGGR